MKTILLRRIRLAMVPVLCFTVFLCSVQPSPALADPKIIEAAKKEGEVIWWSTIAQDQSQKLVEEFMKLYPFIKASYWRSGSVGLHNKVTLEARAARVYAEMLSWQEAPVP